MDAVERVPLQTVQADALMTCERRQRYELAATLLDGCEVLQLCCGGEGTSILSGTAAGVVVVERDMASLERTAATLGPRCANVSFEPGEPIGWLEQAGGRFGAVVWLDGLADVPDRDAALEALRVSATDGLRLVFSHPNDALSDRTRGRFGYAEASSWVAQVPGAVLIPQFLAEGALILPDGATDTDVRLAIDDRREPEYANHFIFCVGCGSEAVTRAHQGRIALSTAPVFNRVWEEQGQAIRELRRENARLARKHLGTGGSAAASAVHRLAVSDELVGGLRHELRVAQERIEELESIVAAGDAADGASPSPAAHLPVRHHGEAVPARPLTRAAGEDPNSWEQRHRRAAEYLIPWIERTVPLAGCTVLEYGCGPGSVSCALAARADRVIGVDIDEAWIARARREVTARRIGNVELEHHPVERILGAVAARRGEVDVFLLYAVLEHLTVDERLAVLDLAREVVRPGGAIVVCETPNRLVYFDHHTAQMPFFHLLPDDLAVRYRDRSPRRDFVETMDRAAAEGEAQAREALARLGRGVSFHEFELAFGDLSRHVIASNYDPLLFGERPVHLDEVILSRYLERVRPDLAPVFSRYWLDLILSPEPVERRPPFVRPWLADTDASRGVGVTARDELHLKAPESVLWVELPRPTRELLVGTQTQDGRHLVLEAWPEGAAAGLGTGHTAAAREVAFSRFAFEEPTARVALQASDHCHVVFVGYAD